MASKQDWATREWGRLRCPLDEVKLSKPISSMSSPQIVPQSDDREVQRFEDDGGSFT